MKIKVRKYDVLGNDFLVLEKRQVRADGRRLPSIARNMCNRRTGVGADGIIYLSAARGHDSRIDIYNADGSWAEKSGNGLRIAGVDRARQGSSKKSINFLTGDGTSLVEIVSKTKSGWKATSDLGEPDFRTSQVPVKSRRKVLINSPLKIAGVELPMTCLSVGNPHAVLFVEDFDFPWREIGADIETASPFPEGTNVEFVRPISRSKIEVAEWERGAGATGSSGTGAAAAVCASVMLGLTARDCAVVFSGGTLRVNWSAADNRVRTTGEVRYIMEGIFEQR